MPGAARDESPSQGRCGSVACSPCHSRRAPETGTVRAQQFHGNEFDQGQRTAALKARMYGCNLPKPIRRKKLGPANGRNGDGRPVVLINRKPRAMLIPSPKLHRLVVGCIHSDLRSAAGRILASCTFIRMIHWQIQHFMKNLCMAEGFLADNQFGIPAPISAKPPLTSLAKRLHRQLCPCEWTTDATCGSAIPRPTAGKGLPHHSAGEEGSRTRSSAVLRSIQVRLVLFVQGWGRSSLGHNVKLQRS